MARRLTKRQAEHAKDAIRAGVIIEALTAHVVGEREMSDSQVRAGLGLLAKVLPDQRATEHSGQVQVAWQLRLT
jgi:hypothetical protein